MNKKEFEKIEKDYLLEKKCFEGIKKGDLVWKTICRGGAEIDYHSAIVKKVNVDERYVEVLDVSVNPLENKKYSGFLTETDLLDHRFTEKDIKEIYKKNSKTIENILE